MYDFVATARRSSLQFLRRLEPSVASGTSVPSMVNAAALARMELAAGALEVADALIKSRSTVSKDMLGRSAVSRSYYAMFQGARAVVYIDVGGDDKNEHSELSKNLPSDFTDSSSWANELKGARLLRNEADYDPYARPGSWRSAARTLLPTAQDFVTECSTWLTKKGVQ